MNEYTDAPVVPPVVITPESTEVQTQVVTLKPPKMLGTEWCIDKTVSRTLPNANTLTLMTLQGEILVLCKIVRVYTLMGSYIEATPLLRHELHTVGKS